MDKVKAYVISMFEIKRVAIVTAAVLLAFWWLHGFHDISIKWYSYVLPVGAWLLSLWLLKVAKDENE